MMMGSNAVEQLVSQVSGRRTGGGGRLAGLGDIGPVESRRVTPVTARRVMGTASGGGVAAGANNQAFSLDARVVPAIKKFLNTMRPGGSMVFDADIAGDMVARILSYYHPQLRGMAGLGDWFTDLFKGEQGAQTISKIADVVSTAITGQPKPAAVAPKPATTSAAAQLGPYPASYTPPVQMLAAPAQTQPTVIVAGGEDKGLTKALPWILGGGAVLVVAALLLKR